ncbi:MAG: 23S rRNA (pseudouridine(1915)-N(3))-methyltransferase RlmH [SAR324 cluster bacterium]|nr:23S rRNA (pseudouridine(1915)-N(3))-methyltransferase RlmH [SAR324 cluster bacterium]
MQGLRIIWVGKTKLGYSRVGVSSFVKRITPLSNLECIEVRGAVHSNREPEAAIRVESDAILKRLQPREPVILLHENGKQHSSRELAQLLGNLREQGSGGVTFVLGGAYGVDERVEASATETISLSRMTFPHQLVRVMLLEQIYRALTLHGGHAYHHD